MASNAAADSSGKEQDDQRTKDAGAAEIDWPAQLAQIQSLVRIVEDERLSELELEHDGIRVVLRAAIAPAAHLSPLLTVSPEAAYPPVFVPGPAAGQSAAPQEPAERAANQVPIVSPMVGVFYRASSPDNPPLVEIDDYVEIGQVIGIIEAMKVFNEITSEVEGTVIAINAQNAELVETGAPLIVIRTA